jgi:error-prone DNA polymerase
MIQRGETTGVFQIESRAQMSMLPRLKPACFYDLVIEVAIVRPGPIQGDMVHPYLRRRQGLEPVSYPSEAVKEVLERTLGVPIFQEQVIKVAMVAAGFSPGEADRLRRSIAAWRRRGTLEQFEQRLIDGMVERGYEQGFAQQIYHQILGFGEYGFPESHAASFALLVYVSAWLKHHQPAAFFAAILNSQPMGFYAPAQLVAEARRQGVALRPVDVRFSGWDCILEPEAAAKSRGPSPLEPGISTKARDSSPPQAGGLGGEYKKQGKPVPCLRLGLRMIKNLSRNGVERLLAARRECPFSSVDDLARRAVLNKKDLQALAAANALAGLTGNRHQAGWEVMGLEQQPPLWQEEERIGVARPPRPGSAPAAASSSAVLLPKPTEGREILSDYASVGLTLQRHPLALLREHLRQRGVVPAEQVRQWPHGRQVRTAGIVINRQCPASANSVTFVTLEDETGQVNLVVWKRLAEHRRRTLLGARLLAVIGEVQREGEVVHVIARELRDYSSLLGGLMTRSRDFH